jgi:hypothetical protein
MKWPKPGLLVLPLILAGLAALFGAQWWNHRQEEPLRRAIGDLKAEQYATSLPTIRRFARSGHHAARLILAEIYARGIGVPADPVQASIWYRRIECGCMTTGKAEHHLAMSYLEGQYGAGKEHEVLLWLRRAADAGNQDAQRLLVAREVLSAKGVAVPDEVSSYWRRILSEP